MAFNAPLLLYHTLRLKRIVYFDICIEKKESELATNKRSLRHKKRSQSSQSKGHVKLARTGHPKGHHFLRPPGCHIFSTRSRWLRGFLPKKVINVEEKRKPQKVVPSGNFSQSEPQKHVPANLENRQSTKKESRKYFVLHRTCFPTLFAVVIISIEGH